MNLEILEVARRRGLLVDSLEGGDIGGAIFSEDRRYRYYLRRRAGGVEAAGECAFLMLNPSTADEVEDDATIRRCTGYARSWGYAWLNVVNLSPFRSPYPKILLAAGPDPAEVWDANLEVIEAVARASDVLVAAYGNDGEAEHRGERVLTKLRALGLAVACLRETLAGHPYHPVRQGADLRPVPYARW